MAIPPKKKRPTNQDALEGLAVFELPGDLQAKLQDVKLAIERLKHEAAKNWDVEREFSPDGRFLGDVGELIAKLFYGVKLTTKQQKGHDAVDAEFDAETTTGGKKVEIKLRSRSTNIHFTGPPADIILVIYVSPSTLKWGEVCNGPGECLLDGAKALAGGKLSTDCFKLLAKQKALGANAQQLKLRTPLSKS